MAPKTLTPAGIKPFNADSLSDHPQDLLSQAAAVRDDWTADDRREQRECEQGSVSLYLTLLQRIDNPEEGDAIQLAQVMMDLDLDAERIATDRKIIRRARRFERLHDDLETAREGKNSAMHEYRALEKRHREEERAAYIKKNNAAGHLSQCSQANHDLKMLRRNRQLLFAEGNDHRVRLVDLITVE